MSERPVRPAGPRAVALGGGHGLARSLEALTRVVDHVTAVVTVADDGGSSGRLRRDLGVVAPGDLRMALAAMARDRELADLVQYRFGRGELAGHSLGNLVLVALQDLAGGDVEVALARLGRLLDVPGRVVPCTPVPITLHAQAADGPVSGQVAIARTAGLRQVWIDPASPPATETAVAAIAAADLVVLGPGSLYTSILPNLLVPDIAAAVASAPCPTVLIANLCEQRGETEGLSLGAHLEAMAAHVPDVRIDVVLAHAGAGLPRDRAPLQVDPLALTGKVGELIRSDLHDGHGGHDPVVLGRRLHELLAR